MKRKNFRSSNPGVETKRPWVRVTQIFTFHFLLFFQSTAYLSVFWRSFGKIHILITLGVGAIEHFCRGARQRTKIYRACLALPRSLYRYKWKSTVNVIKLSLISINYIEMWVEPVHLRGFSVRAQGVIKFNQETVLVLYKQGGILNSLIQKTFSLTDLT